MSLGQYLTAFSLTGIYTAFIYNRYGWAGKNVVKLCPHEFFTLETSHGFFRDTYSYVPNDSYIRVTDSSIRPLWVISSTEQCWGSFEKCGELQ